MAEKRVKVPGETSVPQVTGSEAAYERFLPAAKAIDARSVVPMRIDGSLAYHNVSAGVRAVMAQEARVRKELPGVAIARIAELPELALAVIFAASQVDRSPASTGATAKLLERARAVRELLLTNAEALALAGVLPAREVARIRAGRGPIDTARDCVDLAALFRKSAAAVKGRTPITADQLAEAARVGTELLGVLKPTAAKRSRTVAPDTAAAVDARDRLWTLVTERHDLLRRVGAWLFGLAAVEAQVPPLHARAAKPRKAPAPATPQSATG